ncbi:hypothetical protein OsccyDRAFT_4200 [Leptolyngbyaceae cyanobacterium JSC-12]|nr:hypothetical protein OsccyDRAFT_4200 [Leptolyngbyaceae cyanobacterium JSC-12]
MLHLAQVEKIALPDKAGLRLLARQRSEYSWSVISEQELLPIDPLPEYGEGALVLVTLSETRQIQHVESATNWIIDIIQTFLRSGITPTFLQEESERAEHWRQTLTLQSQDLDRRALELEARREQIEQLEEALKREKKQMELLANQYKEQTQELDRRMADVEALSKQVAQFEEALRQERKQKEELLAQSQLKANPSN